MKLIDQEVIPNEDKKNPELDRFDAEDESDE